MGITGFGRSSLREGYLAAIGATQTGQYERPVNGLVGD